MSIRLDPRRVNALKHLAGEAGVRPGDLVRRWVEERIDAARTGSELPAPVGETLLSRIEALTERVAALESAGGERPGRAEDRVGEPSTAPAQGAGRDEQDAGNASKRRGRPRKVTAAPAGERVALHEEMIAVLAERGPMTAADLADAISDRGRYSPPRSGKAIDAAMVSQRVSNPTYRSRFTRNEGRIGLAD